jgi:hypothetical protein
VSFITVTDCTEPCEDEKLVLELKNALGAHTIELCADTVAHFSCLIHLFAIDSLTAEFSPCYYVLIPHIPFLPLTHI